MTIVSGVGASATVSSASGGKVYAYNALDNTIAILVAPANPSRRKITFHNPGDVDVLVFPIVNAAGGTNAPTVAAPGGAFRIFSNGGALTIEGECQGQWNALAIGGATNKPLTVMDSNV
jgi:hypothetical protein